MIQQKRILLSLSLVFLLGYLLFRCQTSSTALATYTTFPKNETDTLDQRKVALGKRLFFDTNLSADGKISCASCHDPQKAFTDGEKLSKGVFGRRANRNAPTLFNVVYAPTLMFDGVVNTLEKQVIVPIQEHQEMGMNMRNLITRLRAVTWYQQEAQAVFKRDFDPWVLTRSIAAYERSLLASDSPFDSFYYKKNKKAISKEAQKGWEIFSGKGNCVACHTPPFFTSYQTENNGLVKLGEQDLGKFRVTADSNDIGYFKVPTLRNIALTAPYMHDGRFDNLDQVLEFYFKGKKTEQHSPELDRINLKQADLILLKAFLESLTDIKLREYLFDGNEQKK